MPKAAKITVAALVIVLGVFCVGSYALDRHLLAQAYERTTEELPFTLNDANIAGDYPMEDVQFTLDGQTLRGHVYGADNTQGLVILRHGIYSHHEDYLAFVTALVDRGWKVFAYDAIGCGESDGDSVIGFAQSPIDVRAAVQFADESGMPDGMPIMLLGHSWGGYGVAGALDFDDVRERVSACVSMSGFDTPTGIIMESAESSMGALAATQAPFIELIGHLDFGSAADRSGAQAILESGVPTLVIHGNEDAVISYDGASIISKLQDSDDPNIELITKSEEGRRPCLPCYCLTWSKACSEQRSEQARQQHGKSDIFEALLPGLEQRGVEEVVLESRGAATDKLDLSYAKYAKGSKLVKSISISHEEGSVEPRLWIADQVLGAMGDYLTQTSNWKHWKSEWEAMSPRIERIDVPL